MLAVMIVNMVLQFIALFGLLTQFAPMLRIGDVARQLTEQDLAAIELVLPDGAKPWLLIGDPAQAPGLKWIEVYLPALTTTAVLRRGKLISVSCWTTPHIITEWTAERIESYAQVAIPGRKFDQITGDSDMNRPFRVIGRFEDEELITLVQFLRSNPPTRGGTPAVRPWPIRHIQRMADDSIEVDTLGGALTGQAITLRRDGKNWIIVAVGMWAA